jgi:hypothetical protein
MAAPLRRPGTTRPGTTPLRRKALFLLLALLVAYSGYAWHAGLAFTAGIETADMDWDADGQVTTREMLQSWYAVSVRTTHDGPRACNSFYWRGDEAGLPIRVDCKTTFKKSED